jgi:uncharacterized protein YciI
MTETKLFAILAMDARNVAALREEHHAEHVAHFKAHAQNLAVAGPIGGEETGSLVIYRAATEEEARTFIEGDPFFPAGVWKEIKIYDFRAASGEWSA